MLLHKDTHKAELGSGTSKLAGQDHLGLMLQDAHLDQVLHPHARARTHTPRLDAARRLSSSARSRRRWIGFDAAIDLRSWK